ncbi:hypothetical protein GEMRC1_010446 [Eukaryota sp. GEM-RC1]
MTKRHTIPSRSEMKRRTGKSTLDDLRNCERFLNQLENISQYQDRKASHQFQSSSISNIQSSTSNHPQAVKTLLEPRKRSLLSSIPLKASKLTFVRNSIRTMFSQDFDQPTFTSSSSFNSFEPDESTSEMIDIVSSAVLKYCRSKRFLPSALSLSSVFMDYITASVADEEGNIHRIPVLLDQLDRTQIVEGVLLGVSGVDCLERIYQELEGN